MAPEAAAMLAIAAVAIDAATMVVHIIPIRRSAHDIFTRSYALLVVTPVAAPRAPPIELMRSLFDLTASEARVARGLALGETLEEIAATGGVAISTVRGDVALDVLTALLGGAVDDELIDDLSRVLSPGGLLILEGVAIIVLGGTALWFSGRWRAAPDRPSAGV